MVTLMTIVFFLASSAQSQPNSCDGFAFTGMNTARNITSCRKLPTLGYKFGWNYHNTNTNTTSNTTVDVVFSGKPPENGWVALGVNPGPKPQMVGTRAILAVPLPSGEPKVNTYNVTADTKRGCKLKPMDVEVDVENRMSYYSDGVITVWATLILPSPAYDVTNLNVVWQMGSRVLAGEIPAGHAMALANFDSMATIDLTTGEYVGGGAHDRRSKLRAAHGILGVIGWGLLMPSGVMVSRYARGFPFALQRWFLLHVGIQMSAYVIGTVAWGIGLTLANESGHIRSFIQHRIIGILVFCFSSLQIVALWLKPNKEDKYRKYWSVYHHLVGYSIIALVITNIFKGLSILMPPSKWKSAYIGILVTLSCIAFGLEIVSWAKFFLESAKEKKVNAQGKP